jgi:hypothetical protein
LFLDRRGERQQIRGRHEDTALMGSSSAAPKFRIDPERLAEQRDLRAERQIASGAEDDIASLHGVAMSEMPSAVELMISPKFIGARPLRMASPRTARVKLKLRKWLGDLLGKISPNIGPTRSESKNDLISINRHQSVQPPRSGSPGKRLRNSLTCWGGRSVQRTVDQIAHRPDQIWLPVRGLAQI